MWSCGTSKPIAEHLHSNDARERDLGYTVISPDSASPAVSGRVMSRIRAQV